MPYAWKITRDDWLADSTPEERAKYGSAGTAGPSDVPDEYLAALDAGKGWTFRMYDDDGELMVTGKAYAEGGDVGSDDFCYGPLADYGEGGLGCTVIRWHGHPEWNCG